MRLERGFLNWGVFLILLGAVPLAVRQGLIARDVVEDSVRLWPLVLVGLGVGLVLRRTAAAFVGGLIVAATFGLILGSALAVGARFPGIGCGGEDGRAFETRQGTFAGPASVTLEMDCGEVALGVAAGTAWSVSGTDADGRGPDLVSSPDGITIRSRNRAGIFFLDGGARERWTVTLPKEIALRLQASVNAGSGRLDLTGARLESLRAEVNAGETVIDLTDAQASDIRVSVNAGSAKLSLPNASVTGRLEVNAGSVKFCAPSGAGLRLTTNDNITASVNFGQRGMTKSGDVWQTPDFASAPVKIELTTTANAGSIELNPQEGCR